MNEGNPPDAKIGTDDREGSSSGRKKAAEGQRRKRPGKHALLQGYVMRKGALLPLPATRREAVRGDRREFGLALLERGHLAAEGVIPT